jgi:xylulokinase
MTLVAGVDSSTQSCKLVVVDADTGEIVRKGIAPHPSGTEVDPERWLSALERAIEDAGGIDDVAAISIAGQQHGMILLDEKGLVLRPALLWNDVRSAPQSLALIQLLGDMCGSEGAKAFAEMTGSVPVASFTITKLRWVLENEPEIMKRAAAVCLPHDWLTWKLSGSKDIRDLTSDRSDASGTGYFSSTENKYLPEILQLATGKQLVLPKVAGPFERVGTTKSDALLAPGMGDNAAAAFGLNAIPGQAVLSLGTSGVVSLISEESTKDASGLVAGFADGNGRYLPLACTLNGAKVIDSTASALGLSHDEFAEAALSAPAGADGLTMLPYFDGERTPNIPNATGSLVGITTANLSPSNIARATIEGLLCGLADALDEITSQGINADSLVLVGGASRNKALQQIAPLIFGVEISLPEPGEYVAIGAARQAASTLAGTEVYWKAKGTTRLSGGLNSGVRSQYSASKRSYLMTESNTRNQ